MCVRARRASDRPRDRLSGVAPARGAGDQTFCGKMFNSAFRLTGDIHFTFAVEPLAQIVGRQIDQYDFIGGIKSGIGDSFAHLNPRDATSPHIVQTFQMPAFTVVKTSIPASSSSSISCQRLGWREPCALLCASHPLKSAPYAGQRGRHPCHLRICRPGASDVLAAEWSARQVARRSLYGHAFLPRRSPHPAPAPQPPCLRQHRPVFPTPAQAPKKIFNFPVGRGRLSKLIRIRTQGFVVHFLLCVPVAHPAPDYQQYSPLVAQESSPAACAYILQPVARPVQREVLASRRHAGIFHAAAPGVRLLSSPPADAPSSAQPEPRNSPVKRRVKRGDAGLYLRIQFGIAGGRCFRPTRQWDIRRIGGGGGPAMKNNSPRR